MVLCKCCQGYATCCRVLTLLMIIAGVVLSMMAIGSCEMVTRQGSLGEATFGLFTFSESGSDLGWYECLSYSDVNGYDSGWLHQWAAVSSVLASSFGIILVGFMLLDCCCSICCSKYMQTFLVVCCWLNQGFTFLIWLSDACWTRKTAGENEAVLNRGCRIGNGSIYSFSAFWLFFIGGFFLCCSPKPDRSCCKRDDDDKRGCCSKDDKKDDAKSKSAEEKPAANEEKPKEEDTTVVAAAAVVKEEEKVEEKAVETTDEEQPAPAAAKSSEETKTEEEPEPEEAPAIVPVPVPVEETREEKEIPEEIAVDEEAPSVVPVPVPVQESDKDRAITPTPEDTSMEVEFDEEFGASINKPWME